MNILKNKKEIPFEKKISYCVDAGIIIFFGIFFFIAYLIF
jgi:hypothetical protein